jgi:hypothetical protein
LPAVHGGLTLEAFQHEQVGPDVLGADCAACQKACGNERRKGLFGQHEVSFIDKR